MKISIIFEKDKILLDVTKNVKAREFFKFVRKKYELADEKKLILVGEINSYDESEINDKFICTDSNFSKTNTQNSKVDFILLSIENFVNVKEQKNIKIEELENTLSLSNEDLIMKVTGAQEPIKVEKKLYKQRKVLRSNYFGAYYGSSMNRGIFPNAEENTQTRYNPYQPNLFDFDNFYNEEASEEEESIVNTSSNNDVINNNNNNPSNNEADRLFLRRVRSRDTNEYRFNENRDRHMRIMRNSILPNLELNNIYGSASSAFANATANAATTTTTAINNINNINSQITNPISNANNPFLEANLRINAEINEISINSGLSSNIINSTNNNVINNNNNNNERSNIIQSSRLPTLSAFPNTFLRRDHRSFGILPIRANDVDRLVSEMGFEESRVRIALRATRGNVNRSIDLLINGPEDIFDLPETNNNNNGNNQSEQDTNLFTGNNNNLLQTNEISSRLAQHLTNLRNLHNENISELSEISSRYSFFSNLRSSFQNANRESNYRRGNLAFTTTNENNSNLSNSNNVQPINESEEININNSSIAVEDRAGDDRVNMYDPNDLVIQDIDLFENFINNENHPLNRNLNFSLNPLPMEEDEESLISQEFRLNDNENENEISSHLNQSEISDSSSEN